MQPNSVGLISARSSSVSLAIPQEPIDDDRSIARGLLHVASHEKSSLTRNAVSLQGLDGGRPRKPDILITSNNFPDGRVRRAVRTSNTWTSSEGDVLEDEDEIDDRTVFVEEYNRLAKKHGVRIMKVEDYEQNNDEGNNLLSKPGWFKRILRRTSSSQSVKARPDRQVKHRRSISDLSLRLKMKKDKLKDKDLQELVRLCGSSILYLPAEYAAGCLSVPTCFRATAQYLVQYGIATRGVFRIPGSHNVVAALYNHYCSMDEHGQVIAGTVRCPTLPDHIKCDVHDVASAFKKFLSGLPGGILGSLSLLDAFISIQTQLAGQAELTRTKQSKVRARLIALAIATLRSQYRRELICAVFGLLCMIGRTAETAQREDSRGRPLPTSDLMGYGPLGIVFGPLLVGDLLEDYSMRLADPYGGLVLLPISPPKSRKERQKKSKSGEEGSAFNTHVDKIKVANSITEMLITHWRDVVRHMRSLNALKSMPSTKSLAVSGTKQQVLRPSASESFALRRPPNWSDFNAPLTRRERSESPTPTQRPLAVAKNLITDKHSDTLAVRKQRSGPRPMPNRRLSVSRSMNILSPTIEETAKDDLFDANFQSPKAAGAKGDISTCDSEEDSQPLSNITFPALKVEENTKREGPSIQKAEFRPVALLHQTNVDYSPSPDTLRSPTPGPSVPRGQESERPRPPHFGEHTHLIIPNAQHGKQAELAAQTIPNRVSDLFEVSTNMQELHLPSSDVSKNTLEVRIPEPIIEIKDIKENRISVSDSEVTEEIKIVEQHTHNTMLIHLPNDMPHDNSTPSLALSSMFNPKNSGFKSVLNPETQEPKTPRRTGGSEPNIPLQSSNKLDRRISKSLYEDPKRKRNLLDWSKLPFQKDPLLRVSEQEDAASLAALAQVMDADMDADYEKTAALPTPRSTAILSTGDSSSEDQSKQTTNHRSTKSTNVLKKSPPITGRGGSGITAIFRQENRRSRADSSQNVTPARSTDVDNSFHSKIPAPAQNTHRTYLNNSEVKQEPAGSIESKRHSDVHGPRLSISDQAKTPTSVLSTRTGETSPKKVLEVPRRIRNSLSEEARTTKRLSSPGKISALVARFNGNSTPPPFSTKSPVKTPVKLTPGDPRDLAKSPGESLLALYTTNGSSPTKSQKSSRSEKAQQARGSPVPREQTPKLSLLDSALVDSKTPKRILRSSLNDPTPLRPTRRAIEIDSSTATRPSPRPSMASRGHLTEKAAEYQSQKSLEGLQEPKPSQNVIESPQGPVPKFFEDSFGFSQQPASARYPSATWRLRQDSIDPGPVSPRKTSPSIASLGSSSQVYYRPPKSFRSAMETARAASPVQSLVDVPAFDGPGSIDSSVERVFPRHKRSSAIQSVPTPLERLLIFDNDAGTANLVHSDSSFAFATSNSGSSRSSPPLRRGSVLQGHIKSLEQQIAEKTVEVNHFRSQVEILRTIDLKRLGEELLRARMEAEMWKSRAEAAERKLQEMNPRSILKRRTTGSSVKRPSPLRSSTESSATEGAQLADKIRQALRGMDGAESSQHETYESDNTTVGDGDHSRSWNSEESTDTVLREVKQRYSGSEYSSWAGHNNQALEPTVSP